MKNIFFLICLAAVIITSCNKEGDGFIGHEWTLEKEIAASMDYFSSQTAETDHTVYFYEAECVLNGKLAELDAKDVKIKSCVSIANVGLSCHMVATDFTTREKQISIYPSAWGGSFAIKDPTSLKISFEQAVEIVKNAKDIQTPNSDKMTLRHPMGTAPNPLYIFGSSSEKLYVAVDAITGEVGYF